MSLLSGRAVLASRGARAHFFRSIFFCHRLLCDILICHTRARERIEIRINHDKNIQGEVIIKHRFILMIGHYNLCLKN